MASQLNDDYVFTGNVTFAGTIASTFARTQLTEDSLVVYPVNLVDLRTWDAIATNLPATAATTINSLTFANKDFTITSSSLAAGDILDVRIAIAITDSATGTAVIGEIGAIEFLLDIR